MQNLVCKSNISAPQSIHLCDYPSYDEHNTNEDLIKEIDTIIDIVSLGRSARNKANIKIRQPLSEVVIYVDKMLQKAINNNKNQILEELNIKNIRLTNKPTDIVEYKIKPIFSVLGEKYGKDLKNIIKEINKLNSIDTVNTLKTDGFIKIKIVDENYKLTFEDLEIIEIPLEKFSSSSSAVGIVAVNTLISDELKNEGIVRDLIRQVQNLRKDSGFKVEDRIKVNVKSDEIIKFALNQNIDYFKNEVLAVDIKTSSSNLQYTTSFSIDKSLIALSIDVNK